jgi:diketogulonate reductase-like aldo/keto reductase
VRDAQIKPAANEMELHPLFQQPELFDYLCENGIVSIGYSRISSPKRPERDRTPVDSSPIDDPVTSLLSQRYDS